MECIFSTVGEGGLISNSSKWIGQAGLNPNPDPNPNPTPSRNPNPSPNPKHNPNVELPLSKVRALPDQPLLCSPFKEDADIWLAPPPSLPVEKLDQRICAILNHLLGLMQHIIVVTFEGDPHSVQSGRPGST